MLVDHALEFCLSLLRPILNCTLYLTGSQGRSVFQLEDDMKIFGRKSDSPAE